jgi:hypothetical protein
MTPLRVASVCFVLLAALACCARSGSRTAAANADRAPAGAPQHLADTGLYATGHLDEDGGTRTLAEGVLSFEPQYPLWTDGAVKERWISLPAGASIDASDVDHWRFPAGTKLWKTFSFGRPVETRYMHLRADGTWLYATYLWDEQGRDAVLAPECGVVGACPTSPGTAHDVPSAIDCRLCHEGSAVPVLGFSALQLSGDRDPLAPHGGPARRGAVDLAGFAERGLVRGLDPAFLRTPPRIDAKSDTERAALGYLHGNCSSCHNGEGPLARLGLRFDYPLANHTGPAPALLTALGVASRFSTPGASERIAPGAPERSVLTARLGATDALVQMPPFGRHLADAAALELVSTWIRVDLASGPDVTSDPLTHRPRSQ